MASISSMNEASIAFHRKNGFRECGRFERAGRKNDQDFDIEYHVRRSALPKPGSDAQLHDLIARLTSRPLDSSRPLWEMYLVEGLSKNRVAIFTKSHSSLVDGESAPEIGQVILDVDRAGRDVPEELWMPRPQPSEATLIAAALGEVLP